VPDALAGPGRPLNVPGAGEHDRPSGSSTSDGLFGAGRSSSLDETRFDPDTLGRIGSAPGRVPEPDADATWIDQRPPAAPGGSRPNPRQEPTIFDEAPSPEPDQTVAFTTGSTPPFGAGPDRTAVQPGFDRPEADWGRGERFDDGADGQGYGGGEYPATQAALGDPAYLGDGVTASGDRRDRPSRKDSRAEKFRRRALARESRWSQNRWSVPYLVDGPKVTLGLIWFLALISAVLLGQYVERTIVATVAVAAVAAPVAAAAGYQTATAWFPSSNTTRSWMAAGALLTALGGIGGPFGVLIGALLGLITAVVYQMLFRGHRRTASQLFDVLVRCSIPAGLAAASLAALGQIGIGAQISVILLVSAYEVGDFLIGSGADNPFEGPLAGFLGIGAVSFLLFLVQPEPFDGVTMLIFAAITAICCPLGQRLASGLLPHGAAPAPALRRLDSYLLVAPLWLVLVSVLQLPGGG
jgi:hypothetical protein